MFAGVERARMDRQLPPPGHAKSLSYRHAFVLRPLCRSSKLEPQLVHFLSHARRPRRSGEWTHDRAVTFIVTLAATQSVTFAARRAGMSRKSAYALKGRDPAFACAWAAAMQAGEGYKVKEVEGVPVSRCHGNASPSRLERERSFTRFMAALRDSVPGSAGATA
jgi:hypothetical protein